MECPYYAHGKLMILTGEHWFIIILYFIAVHILIIESAHIMPVGRRVKRRRNCIKYVLNIVKFCFASGKSSNMNTTNIPTGAHILPMGKLVVSRRWII